MLNGKSDIGIQDFGIGATFKMDRGILLYYKYIESIGNTCTYL